MLDYPSEVGGSMRKNYLFFIFNENEKLTIVYHGGACFRGILRGCDRHFRYPHDNIITPNARARPVVLDLMTGLKEIYFCLTVAGKNDA